MDRGSTTVLVIVVIVGCVIGVIVFHAHDTGANAPTNPDIAAALADAAHGGPLPDRYVPMQVKITAIEHTIVRTLGADSHTVSVSLVRTDGGDASARVWLVTNGSSLAVSCNGYTTKLSTDLVRTLSGCFDLPPGEEPLGVVVVSGKLSGGLWNLHTREALPLPLFGAPAPPGLECESSNGGTVCVTAGR